MKRNDLIYKLYHYTSLLNYIIWLFELEMLILLVNLPLVLVGLVMDFRLTTIPFYLITSQLVLPSLFAGIAALKGASKGDGIVKNFINLMKEKTFFIIKVAWPATIVINIMLFNMTFSNQFSQLRALWWLNLILLAVLITYLINLLLVCSSWPIPLKKALEITAKLSIVKSVRYNLNFVIILGTILILRLFPVYLFIFGISLSLLLCVVNFQPVVEYVDGRPENKK